MAVDRFGRIGRWALWFSPVVIVPGLLALRPWVENDLIAVAIAIFATGYSIFVAERVIVVWTKCRSLANASPRREA